MNDQHMSTEHMIEIVTARVLRQERAARRWRLTFLVSGMGLAVSAMGFIATLESEGYSDEAIKRVARSLDTSALGEVETLSIGVPVERTLMFDEIWSLSIPVEGDGPFHYQIDARGVDDFDPVIGLYRLSERTRPSLLAFNDDSNDSVHSQISVLLQSNEHYELRVHEFSGQPGRVEVSLEANQEESNDEVDREPLASEQDDENGLRPH